MPIEGLPTEGQAQGDADKGQQATTPDAAVNNTGANQPGAGTDTAQQTQAQTQDKTFTQAEVDKMFQTRLKTAVKAELKKLTGETEGTATVEELQRQLSDKDLRIRSFEARETVESFLTDGRNKLNVKPENVRGIQAIVIPSLQYDDDGKPSNLKEAIETAKVIAPALFANTPGSIDANAGRNGAPAASNMNQLIRQAAGYGQ